MQTTPIPEPLDESTVREILAQDATARRVQAKNIPLTPGLAVGVRLNLNIMKSTGVAIQTIHQGRAGGKSFFNGEAIGYAQSVLLKDVDFSVSQAAREAIATGQQNKCPMASVDGILVSPQSPRDFAGVPVRFNPKSGHLFVDQDGFAVAQAEEVVVQGHRVYVRGLITYYTPETAPERAGDAPSDVKLRAVGQHTVRIPGATESVGAYEAARKPRM